MTDTITMQDVLRFIRQADASQVSSLSEALRSQHKMLKAEAAHRNRQLDLGTRVKLKGLRPQYLNGLTGAILSIRGTKCDVTLDYPHQARRYNSGGKLLGVPLSAIDPIG